MTKDPRVYEFVETYYNIEDGRKKAVVANLGTDKNKPKLITSCTEESH